MLLLRNFVLSSYTHVVIRWVGNLVTSCRKLKLIEVDDVIARLYQKQLRSVGCPIPGERANLRPDNTSVKAIVAHFMFSDSGPDEVWAAGKFEEDCDADDVHTRGS